MKKFTLIELLVVMAVIGILLSILLPSLVKARKSAQIAVCASNLSQIHKSSMLYLKNNDHIYPYGRVNHGYSYVGVSGSNVKYKADNRPLNTYLGHSDDNIPMKVAMCPLENDSQFDWQAHHGSSYMAAGRVEYSKDLDGSLNKGTSMAKVNNASSMVFMSAAGAWHFAAFGPNIWSTSNHDPGKPRYTFSFVDGHISVYNLTVGFGISHNRDIIDFLNQ